MGLHELIVVLEGLRQHAEGSLVVNWRKLHHLLSKLLHEVQDENPSMQEVQVARVDILDVGILVVIAILAQNYK